MLLMDSSGEIGDANATYAEGSGTAQLVFEYEVSSSPGPEALRILLGAILLATRNLRRGAGGYDKAERDDRG